METLHAAKYVTGRIQGQCLQQTRTSVALPLSQLALGFTPHAARRQILSIRSNCCARSRDWIHCNLLGVGVYGRSIGSQHGTIRGTHLPLCQIQVGAGGSQMLRKVPNCIFATARHIDVEEGSSVPSDTKNLVEAVAGWSSAFYRFSRPHTIIGSALGCDISVYARCSKSS